MKRLITMLFAVAAIAACLVPVAALAFALDKEYEGHTVACSKLEEATEYINIGKSKGQEEAIAYFNSEDNSCFAGATKFKMEKVVATHQRDGKTVRIVEGKVFGAYSPFGYSPFEKPDTVYFIVAGYVGSVELPDIRGHVV